MRCVVSTPSDALPRGIVFRCLSEDGRQRMNHVVSIALFTVCCLLSPPVFGMQPDVIPLLQKYCLECHGAEDPVGEFSVASLRGAGDAQPELWLRVLDQLEIGTMPPSDHAQPSPQVREQLSEWIRRSLDAAGRGALIRSRLLLPEHGNRVNHELLFSGDISTPPYTPARLWRMSPHVYRGKRYQLNRAGGVEAEPVSYVSGGGGIRDYASEEVMDESGFLTLKAALEDIIAELMQSRELFRKIAEHKGEPDEQHMTQLVEEEFLRATGRRPHPEERQRFLEFMKTNIRQAGNPSGLKITLLGIYLSTEAVYRMELGRGAKDRHGRRMLSPQEIAMAVAYAFGDTPPQDIALIRDSLAAGQLTDRAGVEKLVRALIAHGAPPWRRELPAAFYARIVQSADERGFGWYPRVIRFFDEFFLYSKSAGTFKDSPGAAIGSRALVAAPLGYIAEIVNEDHNVFEELLTSDRFNENREALVARLERMYEHKLKTLPESRHAGVERWYQDGQKFARRLREETFRAGILTSNSWLIAHSTNNENQPVRRGIWVRERLLALAAPALPVDVEAVVPEGHDRTLKEKFEVTKQARCWKCHRLFNPLGMPFESFDDRGWVRKARYFDANKQEYLSEASLTDEQLSIMRKRRSIVVRDVDARGAIYGTGDPAVDGPVRDARELVHRLAGARRVRQSIIRHAFRYWMGRNELLSDSRTLVEAEQAYMDSGGRFSELLVSLLTSDSFLYRR